MNIYLIPYRWTRHLSMGYWCGAFGLFTWWGVQLFFAWSSMSWPQNMDGLVWLCSLSSMVAVGSILGEGNLRRWKIQRRIWKSLTAAGISFGASFGGYYLWMMLMFSFAGEAGADSTLLTYRYRFGAFIFMGLASGIGTVIVRKWNGWLQLGTHLLGGATSGFGGAVAWGVTQGVLGFYELYYASAFASVIFGFLFGVCVWGVPDDLYAGWVRVLSYHRFGHRIPIDAKSTEPRERFVGHYPIGLDLYLPPESSAMELHASLRVDGNQKYFLRGLSIQPTRMKRFLEWGNLDYNSKSPVPVEMRLQSEDRIRMGKNAELEFIVLPREEE